MPIYGGITIIISFLVLLFCGGYLQSKFGMYGLLGTEILLLFLAIVASVITKNKLSEVFPIKKPTLKGIFGTLLLWCGSFLMVMIVTLVLLLLFPEQMMGVSSNLTDFLYSVPIPVAILITAVSPAICEEALFRGFFQHSLKSISNKWVIIIIVGSIFGIFHTDIYRFLPTAILGGFLAYIMFESKNFLYPMIFHFSNNFFTSLIGSSPTQVSTEINQSLNSSNFRITSIALYLIIGTISPFLIYFGANLIKNKIPSKSILKGIIACGIISASMFVLAVCILIFNSDIFLNAAIY